MVSVCRKRRGLVSEREVEAEFRPVLGVDIGGTSCKVGVLTSAGLSYQKELATGPALSAAETLSAIGDVVREVLRAAEQDSVSPQAIGVGVPGVVDPSAGVARFSANLGWRNERVADVLSEQLELPVFC